MAKIRIIIEEFDKNTDTLNLPDDTTNVDALEEHEVGREYYVEGTSLEVVVNKK